MRTKHRFLGAAAAAGLLTAGLSAGAADARPQGDSGADTRFVLPKTAPAGAEAAAAASPTVSPSAPYVYVPRGQATTCKKGNFCAAAWDSRKDKWKVYKLYKCRTYSLSHWKGNGAYYNKQTGSRATATFYGQSGNKLKTVPIGGHKYPYNWNPVWKIRNCY
ncbi:hypothetical protein ACIBKX_15935 [Streptomyces sp. NPDC050658]|uniref:hypothetical protein n=1 Tax=unclassified Streptomyces TaxID=2593676 RepID=UPI0034170B8D